MSIDNHLFHRDQDKPVVPQSPPVQLMRALLGSFGDRIYARNLANFNFYKKILCFPDISMNS